MTDKRSAQGASTGTQETPREFEKTKFTKAGRPRMGTTISLRLDTGEWEDATVVGLLEGKGPEGRNGLIGIIVEFPSDGFRQSFEWPLVPTFQETSES